MARCTCASMSPGTTVMSRRSMNARRAPGVELCGGDNGRDARAGHEQHGGAAVSASSTSSTGAAECEISARTRQRVFALRGLHRAVRSQRERRDDMDSRGLLRSPSNQRWHDVEVLVHPEVRRVARASPARSATASVGRISDIVGQSSVTRTGMSNPGTTIAHRYYSVSPAIRYSKIGIFVVRRYWSKTLPRFTPACALM